MSKRKRREENLRKRVKAITSPPIKDTKKNTNNKEQNNEECIHEWKKHHESRDHTELVYFCENCYNQKTEKQTFEHYKFKLLPHELKNHGPAEHHVDSRKYTAPLEQIILKGDLIKRNQIFNNCFQNKIISNVDVTGLEEKSEILDRIIPKIIVDECVANKTLLKKIQESGYHVWYLGRGLSDEEIFKIVIEQTAILITEDEEFHNKVLDQKLTHDPIFIHRDTSAILENMGVIKRHMKKFECKQNYF